MPDVVVCLCGVALPNKATPCIFAAKATTESSMFRLTVYLVLMQRGWLTSPLRASCSKLGVVNCSIFDRCKREALLVVNAVNRKE